MGKWLKTATLATLTFLSVGVFGQKYLSLEEAKTVAATEAYAIKNADFTKQYIQEDITGAKSEIFLPYGSSQWSMNKDLRHIISFNVGVDFKFGRFSAVKYHKNRMENHRVSTTFIDAAVERDILTIYFGGTTNLSMAALYDRLLFEMDDSKEKAKDTTMKKAMNMTFISHQEEAKNKIRQQEYSYDTRIELLYSIMNIDRPEEEVILTTEIITDNTIIGEKTYVENLQENARELHFVNIDRNVENKNLEVKIAKAERKPSFQFGWRINYDEFTNVFDNSAFIGASIPIMNKGRIKRKVNSALIGKDQIIEQAEYQKRHKNYTVKREYNDWQEKVYAIPSPEAIEAAKTVYESFKNEAINIEEISMQEAMEKSKSLVEAMLDYYGLLEKMYIQRYKAFEEEMKLRQTHKDFNNPMYLVGQGVE